MPEPKKIRKAVIAAAGFGTRFLPQTKAMPKEMLPLVDKPIIQYVVEELVDAGIEDIIIVTGYHKRSIEDHFDAASSDLKHNLKKSGKEELLNEVNRISELANFVYIRQKGPYGNATPILNSEHLIGDEPFIYAFADDFVLSKPSRFRQLVEIYNQNPGSILTCVRAKSNDDYKRYGFVGGEQISERHINVKKIIEKPGTKDNSPSDFATVSGYILEPAIFGYLKEDLKTFDPRKEFIVQPIMQRMIDDGHKFYGYEVVNGKYYDTGNKLEYVKTVVDFALMHDDISKDFKSYLRTLSL